MPQAEPSLASVWTVSSTLPGSSPMMTALPPAATTSSAVWRPIPLLPPTTTSFCPAKTGIDIDRPGSSMLWSLPSSQFMLIRSFLSTGCARGKPAACSRTSLATATPPHAVRTDGVIWARAGDMGPAGLTVWAIGRGEARRYGRTARWSKEAVADELIATARLVEEDRHPCAVSTRSRLLRMRRFRRKTGTVRPPRRAGGQRDGQPEQGELAQGGQVPRLEPAAQRGLRLLRRVDVAAGHPVPQHLRRDVDKLYLVRRPDNRVRHGPPGRGAGDLRHHVAERFQVRDADGGDHVDPRREQVLDVLPPRGVTRAGRVAACKIIHQRDLRAAGQDGAEVYPLNRGAPACHRGRGNNLKTSQQGLGARSAARFDTGCHHIGAVLGAPVAFAEQGAGCAGTQRATQVDAQVPAGGRCPVAGGSAH